MKRIILVAVIMVCAACALAQNRFGIECGISSPTFSVGASNGSVTYRHNVDIKPMIGIDYMRKVDRHVYLGARLGLEAYSFYFSKTDSIKQVIDHQSSYVTLAPTIDFGLGKHQYWHIYVGLSLGFLTNAHETYYAEGTGNQPQPLPQPTKIDNVSSFIFRPGIGLKQHVPLNHYWHITFSEGYGVLLTDLTHLGKSEAIHPGYLTLQMGFMRKFHRPKYMNKG